MKSRLIKPEACAMSSLVGGPGGDWEGRGAADWRCTLQCLCMLRAADTRCYQDRHVHGPKLPRGEAAPRTCLSSLHVSPVSDTSSQVFWQSAPREHALVRKDKRTSSPRRNTKTPSCREGGREADRSQSQGLLVTVQQNCPDHML